MCLCAKLLGIYRELPISVALIYMSKIAVATIVMVHAQQGYCIFWSQAAKNDQKYEFMNELTFKLAFAIT